MMTFSALVLAFLAPAMPAGAADQLRLQQYLEGLMLGDRMAQIEVVFPKKGEWPKSRELSSKLDRIHIKPGTAKYFPANIEEIDLGMRRKHLVSIRIIYNQAESRRKPLSEAVVDYSLIYGEPRRDKETYFWYDSGTVLAIYNAERGDGEGGTGPRFAERGETQVREMHVTVELMERGYFKPLH